MGRLGERYRFVCARCGERFGKQAWPPDSRIHVTATAVTLGLWLVVWGIWQWWLIYGLSRCPVCGRRSSRLLAKFVMLLLGTAIVLGSYWYLIEVAPDRIAQRSASPEPLSIWEHLIVYLSLAATQYGPFILLGWFVFFSAVLLYSPYPFRISAR